GSAQRRLHDAGVAAGDIEEGKRRRERLVERVVQDGADLAMGEVVARDELAVGGPLLLELRERGGVHHRAARFELMDMNVDHLAAPRLKDLLREGSTEDGAQAAFVCLPSEPRRQRGSSATALASVPLSRAGAAASAIASASALAKQL